MAYFKISLKLHPDKCTQGDKSESNEKFSLINQTYAILSNDDYKKAYDETGSIFDGTNVFLKENMTWTSYWRNLFPEITLSSIDDFMINYRDSDLEREEILKTYKEAKGDLDVMYTTLIGFDLENEERIKNIIVELVESNKVVEYDAFINEPRAKTNKRHKKMKLEEKESKQETTESQNLIDTIKNNRRTHCQNFLENLEEKYSKKAKKKKVLK